MAWEVHACEGGDEAAALIERACWREHRRGDKPLVLHADNGSAQRAHTLKSKLETLGITPSHSRPGVSDDNAHIEAWFRTCKYSPGYPPNGFADIELARPWALKFVTWYNGVHMHSGLAYVPPEQRHSGYSVTNLCVRSPDSPEAPIHLITLPFEKSCLPSGE